MNGQIELAKRWTESSRTSFIRAIEATPDDKLTWSPSPTSRTPLEIAVHTAFSNHGISNTFSGDAAGPMPSMDEIMSMSKKEESKPTSRADVIAQINQSCDAVIAALDKVTPERLNGVATTPFGEIPMMSWVLIPSLHMDSHKSQVDYVQTIYGDLEMH